MNFLSKHNGRIPRYSRIGDCEDWVMKIEDSFYLIFTSRAGLVNMSPVNNAQSKAFMYLLK